ncbi:hypothetical protein CCP3SC5AM1_1490005 [Gammaproteobacteria bacterium]
MEKTILIPYTLYKVDYTAHSQRLVTDLDFALLTLIKNNTAENDAALLNFNDLKTELCLPARFISEMISKLMELGLCYIDLSDIICPTKESEAINNIEELQRYQGSEPITKTIYLCRENLTGLYYQKMGYEHHDNITHSDVTECLKWSSKNENITTKLTDPRTKLIIKDAVDNCDLGEARNFIERIEKKSLLDNMLSDMSIEVHRNYSWKHRDGEIKYNFLEITEKDGKLKNVPDEISNSSFFQNKLKEIYGIEKLDKPLEIKELSYLNIKREDICIIKTKHAHQKILIDALKQAKSQILLHTAHISEQAINTLINELSATLNRGVTIGIRVGFEGPFKIAELKKKLSQKMANVTNLLIDPQPTNSDAKLLVYDSGSNEAPFTAIIGSYNWLFETSLSKKEFSDVSIKSTATPLNVKLLDKFPGELLTPWWGEQCKAYSTLSPGLGEVDDLIRIGLLTDREHEEYWLNLPDRENVILASYRISADNPILQQMANKKNIYFIYGKKEPNSSVETHNLHYVDDMHARLCIEKDKYVIITSYSFLSARFDSSKSKEPNHLGIRIIDKVLSNNIWDSLMQLTGRNQ